MPATRKSVAIPLLACSGEQQKEAVEQTFQKRLAFAEPDEVASSGGVLEVTLTSAAADLTVSGQSVHGEAYNGGFIGPTLRLEPGEYRVEVPADHEQGVFWYHSHAHLDSESQVFQALSGAILIGDTRRLLPARFANLQRRLLPLKDLQVDSGAIVAANIDSNAPTTRWSPSRTRATHCSRRASTIRAATSILRRTWCTSPSRATRSRRSRR